MLKSQLTLIVVVLGLLLGHGSPQAATPNFAIIVGDDIGWPHYGFMNHPHVQTPNLDTLATEGTYFPVAYSASSLCRPSNPAIATGLFNFQFPLEKKRLISSTPNFANQLQSRGYRTFAGGKWPLNAGIQDEQAIEEGFDVVADECPHCFAFNHETSQSFWDFLDETNQPWAAWLAPYTVHVPFRSEPHNQIYDNVDTKGRNKKYWASITQMDEWVGDLLNELDIRGELENTIIFYVSDNGQNMKKAKGKFTENGLRSPLIMWCGGEVTNCTNHGERSEFVHFIDIFPTIMGLTGAPMPAGEYYGIDLRAPTRTEIVGHYGRKLGAQREALYVRTADGFLYTQKSCKARPLVWDLNIDPEDPDRIKASQIDQPWSAEQKAKFSSLGFCLD